MFRFRPIALLALILLALSYAGLNWWTGSAPGRFDAPRVGPVPADDQTPVHRAPSFDNQPLLANTDPQTDREIRKVDLQLATLLLILMTFGVTTAIIWRRPQPGGKAAKPSTEDIISSATSTAGLLAKIDQQQQQLDAMQAAITTLARHSPGSATANSASDRTASHSRAQLLAHLSHELRTPLHGMLGNTQLLRSDSQTNPSSLPALETIDRCGQQLLALVNDLIDFARLEDGKLALTQQPCQLQRVVDQAAVVLQAHASERGVALQIDSTPKPLPWVISDGPRLRQLIKRLTISAIDHAAAAPSAHGAIRLHLRLADGSLAIAIKGRALKRPQPIDPSGIDADPAAAQVEDDDLAYAVGSRLVSLFGGEMLSDVATGDFSARIPCKTAPGQGIPAAPDAAPRTAASAIESNSSAENLHCRLMIVDAEVSECARVADVLSGRHCTVQEEPSIERASQRLQDHAYDLVLLAIDEADPIAQDYASELRLVASGEPKVVAFSKTPNAQHLERIGFDAVLSKPVDSSELIAIIEDLPHRPITQQSTLRTAKNDAACPRLSNRYGRDTATQIIAALDLGDVDDLFKLAKNLNDQPGADPRFVEQLTRLAQRFDFTALRQLADQLESPSTDRQPDA